MISLLLNLGLAAIILITVLIGLCWIALKLRLRQRTGRADIADSLAGKETVGFFHPYCAAGGGGERVLWCAIESVQKHHPGLHCVVYTGDVAVSRQQMLSRAESQFGVKLTQENVHFVFLLGRRWVEASTWSRFTLLGQSMGSIYLAWEAICLFCPDIMIDSMGYAFTFPVFKLLGNCRLGCYVHYPTISTDMLARVRTRAVGVCNDALVARSPFLSGVKVLYYRIFAVMYGMVGRFAEVVMVNSSWTRAHIDALWRIPARTSTLYPPCDTSVLAALPAQRRKMKEGGHLVLSLAQFRPEKDHSKQIHAFADFLSASPQCSSSSGSSSKRVRLILAGGCRDEGDWDRFRALGVLAGELGLRLRDTTTCYGDGAAAGAEDWDVAMQANLSIAEVHELLGTAAVGLHTMREEHFGISVVEFMAAGAVVLAHDSGGPAMDIVKSPTKERVGFLATDAPSYAEALGQIFAMSEEERLNLSILARKSVGDRFSQEAFEDTFASGMIALLRR